MKKIKKYIILKVKSKYDIELFSSKKEMCKICNYNYNSIKDKKLPFFKDGSLIQKIELNKYKS